MVEGKVHLLERFNGETTKNYTAEKVENGIYVLRDSTGKAVLKDYHLTDKEHVRATFTCFLEVPPPGSKESATPYFSSVGVHSDDLKTPLEANIQAEVDEVVKKVQDNQNLLREIVRYKNAC